MSSEVSWKSLSSVSLAFLLVLALLQPGGAEGNGCSYKREDQLKRIGTSLSVCSGSEGCKLNTTECKALCDRLDDCRIYRIYRNTSAGHSHCFVYNTARPPLFERHSTSFVKETCNGAVELRPRQRCDYSREAGLKRPGSNMPPCGPRGCAISPRACQSLCDALPLCRAYQYYGETGRCYLKASFGWSTIAQSESTYFSKGDCHRYRGATLAAPPPGSSPVACRRQGLFPAARCSHDYFACTAPGARPNLRHCQHRRDVFHAGECVAERESPECRGHSDDYAYDYSYSDSGASYGSYPSYGL